MEKSEYDRDEHDKPGENINRKPHACLSEDVYEILPVEYKAPVKYETVGDQKSHLMPAEQKAERIDNNEYDYLSQRNRKILVR
jgi:hypothetical protein